MAVNLCTLLTGTGIPVAYGQFENAQAPPYICYLREGSENLSADNKVYKRFGNYWIELYSLKRDIARELLITAKLDESEIFWENEHENLSDEHLHMTRYFIQIEED